MPAFLLRSETRALAGTAAWLVWLTFTPFDLWADAWAHSLVLFAALVLAPLGLDLASPTEPITLEARLWRAVRIGQLPCALPLLIAFQLSPGVEAVLFALPWLAFTGLVSFSGLYHLFKLRFVSASETCLNFGLIYLAVGGVWLAADRLGHRPLNFEPPIVPLTAIHFHYAGFVLPIVAGLMGGRLSGPAPITACVLVVLAVPLVAIGITASQLQLGPALEMSAALTMSLGGMLVAWLQLKLASQGFVPPAARICWLIGALALFFGMALSTLFGLRSLNAMPDLDIPWMRALHGTANSLGFALLSLIGWKLAKR